MAMTPRLFKSLILILLFPTLLLAWVKQPVLFASNADQSVSADSDTLEKHTRMLSEQFVPRDYTHPENLNLTAVGRLLDPNNESATLTTTTLEKAAIALGKCLQVALI